MRSTIAEVERPGTSATRTTRPPAASTSARPTICVRRPVGALHQDVGQEGAYRLDRRRLVVDDDAVHRLEGEERLGALRLGHDRPALALEAADGGVGVEGHHQHVPLAPRGLEERDVAGVEEVEAAVREDDARPRGPPGVALAGEVGEGGAALVIAPA